MPTIWVLLDDRAGNRGQCLGVAEALSLPFQIFELEYVATAALPNFFMGASYAGLTPSSRINLVPPWPDLVIAAGRRTAPVARKIKKDSGGTTRLVQIMYPGDSGLDEFDLIAVPRHDGVPERANILEITGAPHRVNAKKLAAAATEWDGRFGDLPRPWFALIVGGSTRRRTFTPEMARELAQKASDLAAEDGGSLLVTTSRRTGEAETALLAALSGPRYVYRWADGGENPYFGLLALADTIIVTGDSVSMASEACATSKPVYVFAPKALTSHKHAKLHKELYAGDFARPLEAGAATWRHEPLNAAADIAEEIRRRFDL